MANLHKFYFLHRFGTKRQILVGVLTFVLLSTYLTLFNCYNVETIRVVPLTDKITNIYVDTPLGRHPELAFKVTGHEIYSGKKFSVFQDDKRIYAEKDGQNRYFNFRKDTTLIIQEGEKKTEIQVPKGEWLSILCLRSPSGQQSTYLTTASATIRPVDAYLYKIRTFLVDGEGELLFLHLKSKEALLVTAGKDLSIKVDLSKFISFYDELVPYAILAALIASLLLAYMAGPNRMREAVQIISKNKLVFCGVTLWLVGCGYIFYPSIYCTDLVFRYTNSADFMDFYSSAYMVLNYMLRVLGFDSVIYIKAAICLVFFFNIIHIFTYLNYSKKVRVLFLIVFILCPAIFASVFIVQRHFLTPLLFFTGLSFFLKYIYVHHAKVRSSFIFSLMFMLTAAFMRQEYFIPFIFILFICLKKSATGIKEKVKILTIITVCFFTCFGTIKMFSNYYNPNHINTTPKYHCASLLQMLYPYAVAEILPEKNRKMLEELGGYDEYKKAPTPLYFFFRGFSKSFNKLEAKEQEFVRNELASTWLSLAASQPNIALKATFSMYVDLLAGKYWQLYDSAALHKVSKLGPHIKQAANFGMYRPLRPVDSLQPYILDVYKFILHPWGFSSNIILASFMVLIFPLVFRQYSICTLLNLSFILMSLAVATAASANLYAVYLIFVPIWVMLSFLIFLFEKRQSLDK